MELVLATTNIHKIRELREMFKATLPKVDLLTLHQFDYKEPEETGATLKENAILKAEYAAKKLDRLVLADDSGLFVPALNGGPGVHTRYYAGVDASDLDNIQKLLKAMQNLSDHERSAYYECCLALASPKGLNKCFEGICEGRISLEPKGRHGFAYDPLFIKNDYDKTFAELDEGVKNRISHRRKAFDRLSIFLSTFQDTM